MKSFSLSEDEILRIRSFIKDASDISLVECIYLVSYYSNKKDREQVDVVAITNDIMHYYSILTGEKERSDTLDKDNLELLISNYNEPGRIHFMDSDAKDYPFEVWYYREIHNVRCLANGTILFDRFGDKSMFRDYVIENIGKGEYDNLLQIENIERIFGDINYKYKVKT